jgi:hypothetical protein
MLVVSVVVIVAPISDFFVAARRVLSLVRSALAGTSGAQAAKKT